MKILFISEIQANTLYTSSTNIVTYNLIRGFMESNIDLYMILIYDSDQKLSDIKQSLIKDNIKLSKIFFLNTKNPLRLKKSLILRYLELFRKAHQKRYYKISNDLLEFITRERFEIVFTNSPSIDSISLFNSLKLNKDFIFKKYAQLWSDPIASAGVNYLNIPFQRKILLLLENHLHKNAHKIFYFTDTLFLSQFHLFKNKKFEPIDLFFDYKNTSLSYRSSQFHNNINHINCIYFGNYQSKIRNIFYLYQYFKSNNINKLTIIGEGDNKYIKTSRMVRVINKRFSKDEIHSILINHNFIVAILNKNTIQIPGKIFFDSNLPIPYLILLDGPFTENIQNYLTKFNRFYFVNNDFNSIKVFFEKNLFNNQFNYQSKIKSSNEIISELLSKLNI